jgi:RsmE family RNA methyltransferase
MNLILLDPAEVGADGTARLTGRRAAHVREVLRPSPGARLAVGVLGGRMGAGEVLACAADVVLAVTLDRDPPPRAPVELLLALPRPKILRRVLQAAASTGLPRIVLVGSYRVEKSYWGSPLLAAGGLDEQLRLGLEQGRDTVAPEVIERRLFKPFVEDELEALFADRARLLAHGAAAAPLEARPRPSSGRAVLAIGPEGGWTPYEAARLEEGGFTPFTLGPRALRVDVAVPFAIAQLEIWLRGAP